MTPHGQHSHAIYEEHEAKIAIGTMDVIEGKLPCRTPGLVLGWAELEIPSRT
jgi:hypothetical protein